MATHRPGARLRKLESIFCALPHEHRKLKVWEAITEAGGMTSEKAKKLAAEHMRLAMAVHGG
jgi:hypothetical protein